ncbi:MAG: AsmA family protein [Afipia sp.]|nr:AsmA family protein [Afipia sp.]
MDIAPEGPLQTTLLGLAIAFIIALVAALIGPYFVDWNSFRPQFEAEAGRILGASVKVDGQLDARLLPTPTLHLRSVSIGNDKDARKFTADKLDVEFSLAAAMRGELRASELSLDGFLVSLGLDKAGRVEGPFSVGKVNVSSLTIDRLNLAGALILYDDGSGTSVQLDDFKFSGDVRATLGAARGEGSFRISSTTLPFRISSGQSADGKGMRLRVSLDPGDRALFADLDGVLTFDTAIPAFAGALTLARPEINKSDARATSEFPWRVTSRVTANPSVATLDQVEASYGVEDRALHLSGSGNMRFGNAPLLKLSLSARQLDADRLLNRGTETAQPFATLCEAIARMPQPPVPMELELTADQIALGNRPIQNAAAELRGDRSSWSIKKFQMHAPGDTRISVTGMISKPGTDAAVFSGPVSVESADSEFFFGWSQARVAAASNAPESLRVSGNATVAPDRLALDGLKADFGGGVVSGRVAFAHRENGQSRLDATLAAEALDLDKAGSLALAFGPSAVAWPDESKVSLSIGKGAFAGQDIHQVSLDFVADQKSISLNRLSIGGAGGVSIDGSGSLNRTEANGEFSIDARAPSLNVVGDLVKPLSPTLSERLKAADNARGEVRMRATTRLERVPGQSQASSRTSLDIDAPPFKGAVTAQSTIPLGPASGVDFKTLLRSKADAEIKFDSTASSAMMSMLGLSHVVTTQNGSAALNAKVAGAKDAPLNVNATLKAGELDAAIEGSVDPWQDAMKADVKLALRNVDVSTLLDLKPESVKLESLSSKVDLKVKTFSFDNLDAAVAGSRTRGRLKMTTGDETEIDGDVETDALNLSPLIATMLGAAGRASGDPLGAGLMRGWRGSLAFKAAKADFPESIGLRSFSGKIDSDGKSLTIDSKGSLGGGEVSAQTSSRLSPEGTSINLNIDATGVDGTALRYRGLAMPEGKSSIQTSLVSQGRSAAALVGALSGAGTITLTDARIAGLNPQAFETAVRASDASQPTDDVNLKSIVDPVLAAGKLSVPAASIPFVVKDGRIRIEPAALDAPRTRLVVSGGYDLAADQMDARGVLSAAVVKPATLRPEIRIDLNGSPDKPARSIDVASLSSWLVMRSIDRQTQQLDRFERGESPVTPSTMSLEEDLPQVEPIPKAEIKLPNRDPRKRKTNAKADVSPPNAAQSTSSSSLNSAPSAKPAAPASPPKPRPPIVLTPANPGTSSF